MLFLLCSCEMYAESGGVQLQTAYCSPWKPLTHLLQHQAHSDLAPASIFGSLQGLATQHLLDIVRKLVSAAILVLHDVPQRKVAFIRPYLQGDTAHITLMRMWGT